MHAIYSLEAKYNEEWKKKTRWDAGTLDQGQKVKK